MRYLLACLIILMPAVSFAGVHAITRGNSVKISLTVGYMQETMIVLPEKAASVTGVGQPSFQVEPGGDFVMVRSLKSDAHGNLFINFGGGTIVSLSLTTTAGKGEDLVTLNFARKPARREISSKSTFRGDIKTLAGPWDVVKLRSKSDDGGISAEATYAIVVDDSVFVNFSLENDSDTPFAIADVNIVRNTYGGIKGTTVLDTIPIPSKYAIDTTSLGRGDVAYGTLMFSKTYVDFDQGLILKIHNNRSQGPQLRISL